MLLPTNKNRFRLMQKSRVTRKYDLQIAEFAGQLNRSPAAIAFVLAQRDFLYLIQPQANSMQSCPRIGWTRGSGRVGSGRVTILPDFGGSGQHFGFFSFLLIISWYLNRYESSNTTFGLIDFLRYLIHNY